MFRALLTLTLLAVPVCMPSPIPRARSQDPPFSLGTVLPTVAAVQNPQQTFALYLPKRYSSDKRWPIVYVFDPLARGEFALRQFEHAAELHGFIVAASNNSRNGPWPPQFEAAQAMVNDTQQRFAIDARRIYFAGFSGGARVSSQLALLCKCAAGVLLSGAGFPHNLAPSGNPKFVVFTAVGNADFNYSEVVPLQEQLEKAALPHWLRVFSGSHEWAPTEVLDEALAWFRLQAMKSDLEPRDTDFIAAQYRTTNERASMLQQSGDGLATWREYRQAAETFDSLTDVAVLRSKTEPMAKEKSFRAYLKREREAFAEQSRFSEEVLSAIPTSSTSDSASALTLHSQSAGELARDLRQRSLNEKRPERTLILKRALGAVFIGSIESGNAALEKKEYALAAQYFACAGEANPESEAVFRQLAVSRALSGDRKGAIEALRSARKLTKDVGSFYNWCSEEKGFAQFRDVLACKPVAE